jgi:menaquinol-cytochrome c reductase iron-sulfur subunit
MTTTERTTSRRGLFLKLGVLLNGAAALAFAIPIVRYIFEAFSRPHAKGYLSWTSLGPTSQFPEGETRLATYRNPYVTPTDGQTADLPCWVRHIQAEQFQVFAINCAHLGCPVRWFAQSGLFMCPCHGGVYYRDGSRAAGPPLRGLFTYDCKVENGNLLIQAGELPTPGSPAATTFQRKPPWA